MIKYRPHRGGLDESMAEMKTIINIANMLRHIEKETEGAVSTGDIIISESHGKEERIYWNSWRYVLTKRYGEEKYNIPQCIGMCDLGELG